MNSVYKSFIISAVIVLVLASAGCEELPSGGDFGGSGSLSPETEETPENNPGYLVPATPYPTATGGMASPTLSKSPAVTPTSDPYVTLYNQTTPFNLTHSTDAFSFDLTAPPLLIDFTVEPKMVEREKYGTSDYGSKKEGVFKQRYPSEDSWFTVTVRDRESGEIVAENGFGKLFSTDTHKEVYIGRSGDYLIQFSGNEVTVHILVRAGGV
ncbi:MULTISPECIES: hypothetical protein [unclassified Methanoculleus]|jgi:hypothetical protein|uniref:hypothetical protein n=1 Tax=unclassified Methanoculleus TaxID=2619537 RepID=UPI0025DA494B|nr:hypothetical protein [Methanoculleus sp. UBA377]MDD2472584.1 hypothetical protein [Methanoculleus sp.]